MSRYLDLIFVGPEQALPIVVGIALWIGLASLGSLVMGKNRMIEANVIIGWAIVSGIFTVVGVFVRQPFFVLAIGSALLALFGLYRSVKLGCPLFLPGSWRILVLALPILWIAGAMDPSQWDEFSHWLPATKYLLALNGFPNNEIPYLGAYMFPAYPFGWPMLGYLAGLLAGGFMDNVSGIINILLLLTFSTFALRTALLLIGQTLPQTISWGFAALIALFATVFNPTFIQKIVLTAYSDVSTSVVTGFSVLLAYYFLENLSGRMKGSTTAIALQLSLVLSLLVNVRQTNLVIFVIIIFAITLLVLRDREINFGALIKWLPIILIPAILTYVAWRYQVTVNLAKVSGAEANLRAFENWNIKEIPEILSQMGVVAFKKIGFFAPMIIASVLAVRGLFRFQSNLDRISVLIATMFLGYTAFLLLMYVGHFSRSGALLVVSFWRYTTHNGMVAVAFISIGVIYLLRHRLNQNEIPKWLNSVAIIMILVLPLGFAHKLRFDLEPPKPHFIKIAKEITPIIGDTSSVYILDPKGTGESGLITRYYLERTKTQWMSAFRQPSIEKIEQVVSSVAVNSYLLIHSALPNTQQILAPIFGKKLNDKNSYLLKRTETGWTVAKTWEKPANHRN